MTHIYRFETRQKNRWSDSYVTTTEEWEETLDDEEFLAAHQNARAGKPGHWWWYEDSTHVTTAVMGEEAPVRKHRYILAAWGDSGLAKMTVWFSDEQFRDFRSGGDVRMIRPAVWTAGKTAYIARVG